MKFSTFIPEGKKIEGCLIWLSGLTCNEVDSDNDGIYDVIESGNEALDTNNDGIISGLDTGYLDSDLNGASDVTETNVLKDSDADGIIDAFELDSDNDGCNDVQEAGYTDGNYDGILGGSSVTQDSNGKVTSGSDGYTQPQDLNIDLLFDYRDAAYDVGCYNPALDVVKTYTVSDTNGNGINDVGDVINYTVVATNTGGLDLLFTNTVDSTAFNIGSAIFSGGIGVGLTSYFGSSLFVQCVQDQKFDKEIWENEPEQRYKQVNDLINSKILLGKSKQEVRVLLTNDCKYCDDTNNSWMYYLGEGNDNKDFRWEVLDVEFKNDKVFNISIRK